MAKNKTKAATPKNTGPTIKEQLADTNQKIDGLVQAATDAGQTFKALEPRVDAVEKSATAAQNAASAAKTAADNAAKEASAAKTAVSGLSTGIDDAKKTANEAKTSADEAKTSADKAISDISSLQSEVADIAENQTGNGFRGTVIVLLLLILASVWIVFLILYFKDQPAVQQDAANNPPVNTQQSQTGTGQQQTGANGNPPNQQATQPALPQVDDLPAERAESPDIHDLQYHGPGPTQIEIGTPSSVIDEEEKGEIFLRLRNLELETDRLDRSKADS